MVLLASCSKGKECKRHSWCSSMHQGLVAWLTWAPCFNELVVPQTKHVTGPQQPFQASRIACNDATVLLVVKFEQHAGPTRT